MDKKKSEGSLTNNKSITSAVKKPSLLKDKKLKKQEEEERRRLEEEERQKREAEEREIRERERKEVEALRAREQKIIDLKRRELTEYYDVLNTINEKITEHNKSLKTQSSWNRYMRCDGSPNPTIKTEINTFLSLWKEDKETNGIKLSLNQIGLGLSLIEELTEAIKDLPNDEQSKKKSQDYLEKVKELENVIWIKINEASHKLLCNASNKINAETFNFDHSYGNQNIFYCHWANLSHNQKIKDFTFHSKKFHFYLPRFLTLSNVAIRIIFMKFDIYSKNCRTYRCRVTPKTYDFDPIPAAKEEKVEEVKNQEDDGMPPELRALMMDTELTKSSLDDHTDDDIKEKAASVDDIQLALQAQAEAQAAEQAATERQLKIQAEQEEILILQELSDSQVVDLRNFMPVGHIIHFGLYNIPPQPRQVKDWIITQRDYTDVLTTFPYPQSDPKLPELLWNEYLKKKLNDTHDVTHDETADLNKTKKSDANVTGRSDVLDSTNISDETGKNKEKNPNEIFAKLAKTEGPIDVSYYLPKTVYYGEIPQLARWDETKQHWRLDEIMGFRYNEEEAKISFKTYHFSPYCILQDRHVHMPFQSWKLIPKEGPNNCILNIETTTFNINLEILNDQVRVYLPPKKPPEPENKFKFYSPTGFKKDEPKEQYDDNTDKYRAVVEPFANQWFTLETLINMLKFVGLNLFPEPDSEKFVTVTSKDKKLEWTFYRNMASCSCAMAFAYSRWNMEINDEHRIVVLTQLHSGQPLSTLVNPDNYNCLITTSDLYKLSESNESSEELSESLLPGVEEHADLFHLCLELANNNDDVRNRISNINPLYYDTCVKLLEATKVVTYA